MAQKKKTVKKSAPKKSPAKAAKKNALVSLFQRLAIAHRPASQSNVAEPQSGQLALSNPSK